MGVKKAWESERLTKRAAIRAEVDTAIELFLSHRDHVSAHVLAWAATEILRGIAKAKNQETFQQSLETSIKSDGVKEWRNWIKKSYNFAKHADRDPIEVIEAFRPESTSFALFGACCDYHMIFGQRTWPMVVFQAWFHSRNPSLSTDPVALNLSGFSKTFGSPDTQSFRTSTQEASKILLEARNYPSKVSQIIPEQWQKTIEW